MRAALAVLICLLLNPFALAQSGPEMVTSGEASDVKAILDQSRAFSAAYVRGDIDALVAVYAEDGVAASGGRDFVRGREALLQFWALPEGRVVTHHEARPVELHVAGDLAYDWGYYGGQVAQDGEARPPFRGKYLIVWQRDADGVWRIAHDMWNSLPREPDPAPSGSAASHPLVGAWVAEAFGGEIHERWQEQPDGSLIKTEGYFIAAGDTSYSERVRIGEVGGAVYLVAHPSPGGVKVWEQTAASPTGMTFENPNEPNPSRIVYVFSGDGAFVRTLHGREGGEEVVNELRFARP